MTGRFRDRLLLWLALLLGSVLSLNLLLVRQASFDNARRSIDADLRAAARIFERVFRLRLDKLALGARLMSDDWAFRRLYGETEDFADPLRRRTLVSGLENYRQRTRDAAFLQLVSLDGELLADTGRPEMQGLPPFAQPGLLAAAEQSDDLTAVWFAPGKSGGLELLVVVPLLLPEPSGWIVTGFEVDERFAHDFRELTGVDVSFLRDLPQGASLVASSLPRDLRAMIAGSLAGRDAASPAVFESVLGADTWIGTLRPLPGDGQGRILLQRSLSAELAPFRGLQTSLIALTAGAMVASVLAAALMARRISRPVQDLSEGAKRIGAGVYDEPVAVRSRDELGRLAVAFNEMAAGLQERDRVRDLLGRHVSPAVASELMRRPGALGGEEREVTVLFTDIRSFTALSEARSPTDLLDLLNAYFTELSTTVERHGGIVDKYIGDAVMAVFGAPVDCGNHALRAVECARALRAAVRSFNDRCEKAGLPRLETGMGLATGRVVAGVMGSQSRHNYTFIGDTVNLAARLQEETKALGVDCVVAASTAEKAARPGWFVPLAAVGIRGKSAPVAVCALR